ncbi:Rieske 2Fe-2S domain-containing protein [soil metagenome]
MAELFAICETRDVQEEEVRGFTLARLDDDGAQQPWPILITRKGGRYFGYENACPHEGSRLDTAPGEFMDEEGNFIACGKHKAMFDLDSGHCFIGPCQGKALVPLTLIIDDGDICIVDAQLTDEDGLDIPDPDAHPEVLITPD